MLPGNRIALFAALLLAPPLTISPAYQPPVVEPGGSYLARIRVWNDSGAPATTSARARVVGHPYWGPPSGARGPWIAVPPQDLEPGETRELTVSLAVPEGAPPILSVEVRGSGQARWIGEESRSLPMVEGPEPGYRTVAGGRSAWDLEATPFSFVETVVRTPEEWDLLRARLGIVAPDSWSVHPDGGDPQPPYGGGPCQFAREEGPDLEQETLLAIRAPDHGPMVDPRRFRIRSVSTRSDGTVVCRYTWRAHRSRGGVWVDLLHPGDYLLVAIPRTDGPVVLRRVP